MEMLSGCSKLVWTLQGCYFFIRGMWKLSNIMQWPVILSLDTLHTHVCRLSCPAVLLSAWALSVFVCPGPDVTWSNLITHTHTHWKQSRWCHPAQYAVCAFVPSGLSHVHCWVSFSSDRSRLFLISGHRNSSFINVSFSALKLHAEPLKYRQNSIPSGPV